MKRHLMFGLYTICLLWAGAGAIGDLIQLSHRDESTSHLVLMPFVTLALLYPLRLQILASARASYWGVGVGLAGVGLWIAARLRGGSGGSDEVLTMIIAGQVVTWIGGFILFYGPAAARAALLPLLFLGFAIPVPQVLLDGIIEFLKSASAELVAALFTFTATPYHREGFVFTLPSFVIEVADECSGIRSSIALLLTTLLAGHMFLKDWRPKVALVALVVPLAVLKNGIRIVSLSLLAEHVDPGYLTGKLHHQGGIVFFLLTLAMLVPCVGLLKRLDARRARTA